ncbi:RING finger protein nhl-1-like isoform X2 [Leptopilina boulardi]|uniref:RING finger protein nhl-1-like isoform X2 n=1 Tax=Leptopilina boulardi TaxID=63433 RepID=UPI0021F5ADB8|nr:RING finger protein nhl-1-like isoform X2 [Leptopilina boulardi]
MASKLKSIFKKQISEENKSQTKNSFSETIKNNQKVSFLSGDLIIPQNSTSSESSIILRKKHGRSRRNRTSLGAIEEILRCAICNERFKMPKMLPCQHTFCLSCLQQQLTKKTSFKCSTCFLIIKECSPENLPTNLYIENMLQIIGNNEESSEKIVPKSIVVNLSTEEIKCFKCRIICNNEEQCKHCRQIFCNTCWLQHVNDLKDELDVIVEQLDNTNCKINSKINELRTKVNGVKENFNREIEAKILELDKLRKERIQKANDIFAKDEKSAEEIKQKICNAQVEVIETKAEVCNSAPNNQEKVKLFLELHRKMTELMSAVSIWEANLTSMEIISTSKNHRSEISKHQQIPNLHYKNKSFIPQLIYEHKTIQRPSGLAFDSMRNDLFVACPGIKPKIIILDKKFKFIKSFYHVDMIAPQRVAYHEETEQIFVTDKWRHCIFVFHRHGDYLRKMCSKGREKGQLQSPEGISIHPNEQLIYIADTGNDRIVILNFEGTYHGSIGSTKNSAAAINTSGKTISISVNHLNQPADVAVSIAEIVVADSGNHKIKIFNHKGQLVHYIGGSGILRGLFRTPEVVQLDNRSNILVGDSGNSRVQIFSRQGELLKMFGAKGTKSGQFGWISGLVIKANLDIIIADNKNNNLQLF